MPVLRAAIAYWAVIFALGFALGTLRVIWGAEALGETAYMLGEVALLLVASAWAAHRLTRCYRVRSAGRAAAMGMIALTLLMMAELALAVGLGVQAPAAWFADLWQVPRLYGTLGQIAFGLLPLAMRPAITDRPLSA